MRPTVPDGTFRGSNRDIVLNGVTIPRGTTILIPFMTIFNDPDLWDQPDTFLPVGILVRKHVLIPVYLHLSHEWMKCARKRHLKLALPCRSGGWSLLRSLCTHRLLTQAPTTHRSLQSGTSPSAWGSGTVWGRRWRA